METEVKTEEEESKRESRKKSKAPSEHSFQEHEQVVHWEHQNNRRKTRYLKRMSCNVSDRGKI